MCLHYDPIENAIEIQLGGVFSQGSSNPEFLITSAIDQKYYRRKTLTEKLILFTLQGYTQDEIGRLLGISQQHVGRLMCKIPVSDPYIVGGMEKMDRVQKIQTELRIYQIHQKKTKHPKAEAHPDPRGWRAISEGGYLKRRLPTCDRQFEEEL
jgi:hypothetical protein